MSDTYKDASRKDWSPANGRPILTPDIQTGCLQRIADATEAMAQNFVQLQKDAELWKREYYREKNRREMYQRSVTAHKANYTRLKNKFEALKNDLAR